MGVGVAVGDGPELAEQASSREERQKMDKTRTVADRGIGNPLVGIEWDYRHSNHALQRPFKGARGPTSEPREGLWRKGIEPGVLGYCGKGDYIGAVRKCKGAPGGRPSALELSIVGAQAATRAALTDVGNRLPRKRLPDPAVHRNHGPGGLGRTAGGQEQHRLRHVLGENPRLEQVALAVEVLQSLHRNPVG